MESYNSSVATYMSIYKLSHNSRVADRGLNRESNSRFKIEDRNEPIEHYFNLGYQQKEILSCVLLIHDQNLSSRQLMRILSRRSLTGRKQVSNLSTELYISHRARASMQWT